MTSGAESVSKQYLLNGLRMLQNLPGIYRDNDDGLHAKIVSCIAIVSGLWPLV